jgi:hypothetical protein
MIKYANIEPTPSAIRKLKLLAEVKDVVLPEHLLCIADIDNDEYNIYKNPQMAKHLTDFSWRSTICKDYTKIKYIKDFVDIVIKQKNFPIFIVCETSMLEQEWCDVFRMYNIEPSDDLSENCDVYVVDYQYFKNDNFTKHYFKKSKKERPKTFVLDTNRIERIVSRWDLNNILETVVTHEFPGFVTFMGLNGLTGNKEKLTLFFELENSYKNAVINWLTTKIWVHKNSVEILDIIDCSATIFIKYCELFGFTANLM